MDPRKRGASSGPARCANWHERCTGACMATSALALSAPVFRELPSQELARIATESGQCSLTAHGALVLRTGKFTGRSPGDRFIVRDDSTAPRVDWNSTNVAISPENFAALEAHVREYLRHHTRYELELHAGGPAGSAVRLVTTSPAHALFSRHLFQAARPDDDVENALTILHTPDCAAIPALHGTK